MDVLAVVNAYIEGVTELAHNVVCGLTLAGHHAHFGQAIRGPERGENFIAEVVVSHGTIHISWAGHDRAVFHHHDPERLARALELRSGPALIVPSAHLLRVPHGPIDGHEGYFCFSLSADPLGVCRAHA